MRVGRFVPLLVAAAILFSQMASSVHLVGHWNLVHAARAELPVQARAHPVGLSAAEHAAYHDDLLSVLAGQTSRLQVEEDSTALESSCLTYHVYAGHPYITSKPDLRLTASAVLDKPDSPEDAGPIARLVYHPAIRDPPLIS